MRKTLHGIEMDLGARRDLLPALDPGFVPLGLFLASYGERAGQTLRFALSEPGGRVVVRSMGICGTDRLREADLYAASQAVKLLLWQVGGSALWLEGDLAVCEAVAAAYRPGGARAFDAGFMETVYGQPFAVHVGEGIPAPKDDAPAAGRSFAGCRIGFDAGGSDRKVSAVIDGEVVYSEETVWTPKTMADGLYHVDGVRSSLRAAAAHLPRVDAIGISSAGIYADNRTLYAQLFGKVPPAQFDALIRDIYIEAVKEFGDVPLKVANDGDVTALAGSVAFGRDNLLGIAMGTSEAVGFIDREGRITGWLNELAFAPVDASPHAEADDWSGDIGCGYQYFSQEAVIRLAGQAGVDLSGCGTPGEKLKQVQDLLAAGDARIPEVYRSAGRYLGHTTPLYHRMYGADSFLLLGRVMSGQGGEILVESAREVMDELYGDCPVEYILPNEEFRRLGQSVVAASLSTLAAKEAKEAAGSAETAQATGDDSSRGE
ncbi:MAG: ROK family protein [Clostridiales Family XIII bacterium]|jgi:predicted NBD/HSP70 family sugar kinase|nr:ROK family protein [Clostridiales Family XIII bacterium]